MVQENCLKKPKVVIIVGPTASGKTAVGVSLAKTFNGEVISADSMQIYRYMNIGTAKVTNQEMDGIPHHLIDIVDPTERFSVAEWVDMAKLKITEIIKRGKTPIIVGGTGLYVTSLIKGYKFNNVPENTSLREHYHNIFLKDGADPLYAELIKRAPDKAKSIGKNKVKAIIRALEVVEAGAETIQDNDNPYDYLLIGLEHDRAKLYDRINARVDQMINNGLLDEFSTLCKTYGLDRTHQSAGAIGYKELFDLEDGRRTIAETINLIKQHSRNYAKRQLTWMRKMDNIIWLFPKNDYKQIESKVRTFLGETDE